MSLEQSSVLVDRALVTLCQELPESLGLYNTGKDQLSLGALRAVPLLESLAFDSKKHLILRDWMRAYEPKADQPLSSEISMDTLRQTLRDEKRQSVSHVRGMYDDLLASSTSSSASKTASSSSSGASVAATAHAHRKQERRERRDAKRGRTKSASSSDKTRATNARQKSSKKGRKDVGSGSGKAAAKRPRKRQEMSDESEYESSSSSSSSAGSTSSLSSDSGEREEKRASKSSNSSNSSASKSRAKAKSGSSNLPPVEVVLSSDEDDDEPNDLFDTEDPDVYEVETILDKRKGVRFGDPDLYLIKWVGYEAPTWEPAANVSKDLVEEFEGQPVRENEYVVEEIRDRKSSRDKDTKLKSFKYLIKWVGYDDLTWEPADNLPHNLRRKFDQRFEARKRRKTA